MINLFISKKWSKVFDHDEYKVKIDGECHDPYYVLGNMRFNRKIQKKLFQLMKEAGILSGSNFKNMVSSARRALMTPEELKVYDYFKFSFED